MRRLIPAVLALAVCAASPALAESPPPDEPGARDLRSQRQEIEERIERIEANPEDLSAAERLGDFIELYFDYTMLEHPEFATFIGYPGDHGRWTDSSLEAIERRQEDTRRALEVLRTIAREELEGSDRLNYDLLVEELSDSVAGQRFPGEYLVINQMGGLHTSTPRVLKRNPARTVEEYEAILSRLRGIPQVVENDLTLLREGLDRGVTPPEVTLRDLPEQILRTIPEGPMESPLLDAFTQLPGSIPEADRRALTDEAKQIYRDEMVPAFRELHDYLTETYIPDARESVAMSDLPGGDEWYAYRVEQMTTTDMSPEEIHEIGRSEVARIRAEMERIKEETGFEGTLAEFFEFLRTDPQFYYDEPEQLLEGYREISKRADPELVKLFGTLPRLPYGVKAVPEEIEKSQTTAYYEQGSLEAGQPGYFFANTYDLDSRPKWEMEALTLHEAVPGHHLQISLAQEREDLPWFRRFGGETAFVEGWGLYSESLGEEMGFYEDPYMKFGQLTYEMWRAIRLVVDTGMHAMGWSRQEAIDFFQENAGKSMHDITVEVDRYIVWPGQALAYKIGELKIKELRAHAERQLGERFDIREFHDTVLLNGALPLDVLERQVKEWVKEVKDREEEVSATQSSR